jgi:hypothetical protein
MEGQKECVDMDTRRQCNDGRWRMMECNGRNSVCMAGDCVPPPAMWRAGVAPFPQSIHVFAGLLLGSCRPGV